MMELEGLKLLLFDVMIILQKKKYALIKEVADGVEAQILAFPEITLVH